MIKVIVDGACGRMGRMLTSLVTRQPDMELVGATEYPAHPKIGVDVGEVAGIGSIGIKIVEDLTDVINYGDVVIEFTSPEATISNFKKVVDAGKSMVIGTTGCTIDQLAEIRLLAEHVPCLMSPNMSVGVNVMLKAIELVAKALGDEYDVEVIEAHHNQKADSPSGTAVRIADVLATALDRDINQVGVYGREGIVGARPEKEIGIHAIRGGDIVGDHTVLFAGIGERVEVSHRAQSRESFASGAVRAARWIINAPKGLHDISEVLF